MANVSFGDLSKSYSQSLLDDQQQLEQAIDVSQDLIIKIQQLMPKILKRKEDAEIKWCQSANLVFCLKANPHLIFKTAHTVRSSNTLAVQKRFANMVKAVEVCRENQLNLLIVPHAKKFDIDGITLIAEECLDIIQNESAQEHFYHLSGLNETARQLAVFIAKTGFSDVVWRNIPVVDTAPEFLGNRRVALVDLEEMKGAETGIFGGFHRRGLIGCLHSESQIDIALTEAQRLGVESNSISIEEVKAMRIEEIQLDQQLQEFYTRNGILEDARKPIQVDDLTTLDLNYDEHQEIYIAEMLKNGSDEETIIACRSITRRDAVVDVIAQINQALKETPENASIKGKRYIFLDINNNESLRQYNNLGLPKGSFCMTNEDEEQIWLRQIINALVAKGHLFKLVKVDGNGYYIQA